MKRIETVSDIAEFADKIVVVEFGWNPYKTGLGRVWKNWEWFSNGAYGYAITMAVGEDRVHSLSSITDRDIEKGSVKIRLATAEEIAIATPSYDEVWPS